MILAHSFTYEVWYRLYTESITADIDTIKEVYYKQGGNTGDIREITYKISKL
jgi:hypothetical protein